MVRQKEAGPVKEGFSATKTVKKVAVKKAHAGTVLYVSTRPEEKQFKWLGIRAFRDSKYPGPTVWHVPEKRVEAAEVNHFVTHGRIKKA